jgi:hypothetical protein
MQSFLSHNRGNARVVPLYRRQQSVISSKLESAKAVLCQRFPQVEEWCRALLGLDSTTCEERYLR